MRERIKIDDFSYGIITDSTIPARNGFSFGQGIDIFSNPGRVQASQALIQMDEDDNAVSKPVYWMTNYTNSNSLLVGYGNARLWGYGAYISDTWSTIRIVSIGANEGGLRGFGDTLYYAGVEGLGTYNGINWDDSYKSFTADDNAWHPMEIYLGKLMVGDGRYIATLDSTGTWNVTALTLPVGHRVRTLTVFNGYLMIGTWQGDSQRTTEKNEAILFSWDGVSGLPTEVWSIQEQGISALRPWRNNLWVFAGTKGNIYRFNGATLEKVFKIPNIGIDDVAWVNPGAVTEYGSNLIFGLSSTSVDFATIYSLGQNKVGDPIALTSPYNLSVNDFSGINIYSIYSSINQLYVAYQDSDSSNFGIDRLNMSSKVSGSNVYWESQIYELTTDDKADTLRGIELICDKMTVGTILIKYKTDDASSWSTLGEVDSVNQDKVFYGINDRAKTIQTRLEFECSGNTSPKVKTIKIY